MSHADGVTLVCLWHVDERACGEAVEDRRSRALRDTTEAATRLTRRGCDAGGRRPRRQGTSKRARRVLAAFRMGDRRTCCSSLPAASVTGRGLEEAGNDRSHH